MADGIAYVTSLDGYLYAVNISSGQIKWEYNSYQPIMSSPTVDVSGRRVYLGNHGGTFYALNLDTGSYLWSFDTDGRIISSATLVVNLNTVIFGSFDGYVYLLNWETGDEKQRIHLLSGLTGVPVTVGNYLYLFDHLGYFYAYSK